MRISALHKSPSSNANLKIDDIIVEIGNTPIGNEKDYELELGKYSNGDAVMLRVIRDSNPIYIAFEIE